YYAESGDFSAAGGIDMELLRSLPSRHVVATGGGDSFGRLRWAESFSRAEDEDLLVAVDLFHRDGPWTRDEENEGAKALVRYSKGDTYRGFTLTAMGYDADWLSTDQVPRRAVESGQIDRFDLVDPGPRGATERYSLSAEYYHGHSDSLTRVRGYLLHYDFDLISNFTYFLEDEDNGDQFEQKDRRLVAGLDLRHSWLGQWGDRILESSAGFQLRTDDIENGLFRTSDLVRLGAVRQDDVDQFGGGPWIETQIAWSDTVRTRLGLRADYYRADVSSDLATNSGTEEDWLLSPKLSVILGPWSDTEVYVNAGYGFHSNDARGAVIRVDPVSGDPVDPVQGLVRAKGADIGVRTTSVPGLQSTFTVFALELDSELVFVGDGGATEASRPSRRLGIEWTNFYRIRDWLTLDLDLTWTDAEFTDDDPSGDRIPGAIEETLAAGVSVDPGGKFFGSLRWRYFGAAPLIEDDSVRSTTSSLVDGRLGYRLGDDIELHLDVFNLFDREASDIEYFYASRLPGEPSGGIEDIHFHPVESRTARLSVSWRP
ncbi:MAG: TonB-dependent receptor, partial [Acidobacteriota bacterium]